MNHVLNIRNMTEYTSSKGFRSPEAAVVGGGLMMIFGSLSVVSGVYPLVGSSVLIVFLAVSTPIVHDFRNFEKGDDPLNYKPSISSKYRINNIEQSFIYQRL